VPLLPGLGWSELPGGCDEWSGFLLGGVLLTLYPLAALAAEAGAGPPRQGAWTGVTLGVNVDSADAVDEEDHRPGKRGPAA
jgi:hypothetical protein